MVDQKMCRLCMDKDNLTCIWGKADSEKIIDKIYFVCEIKVRNVMIILQSIKHPLLCLRLYHQTTYLNLYVINVYLIS